MSNNDKSKFLGASNVRLIKQLFVEYDYISENDNAVYTLSRHDKEYKGKVYPSLYRLYMTEGDVTEARFVEKYLYDWEQWERMQKSAPLSEEIEAWRRDLKLKVAGQLVDELVEDAFDKKSKSRTSSAKYLLDNIIKKDNVRSSKGRPSSKNNDGRQAFVNLSRSVEDDLERVRNLKTARGDKNGTS